MTDYKVALLAYVAPVLCLLLSELAFLKTYGFPATRTQYAYPKLPAPKTYNCTYNEV
jgi:hypothetical protein